MWSSSAAPRTRPRRTGAFLNQHAYGMGVTQPKRKVSPRDFFTFWKDADPDIPILKEAKAEYAKLQ